MKSARTEIVNVERRRVDLGGKLQFDFGQIKFEMPSRHSSADVQYCKQLAI